MKIQLTVPGLPAEGLTTQGIARRLLISLHTVNRHLEKVYRKLHQQPGLHRPAGKAARAGALSGTWPSMPGTDLPGCPEKAHGTRARPPTPTAPQRWGR
ncbi:LuxR C-terminal-related transcriptional regulator [Streptomyces abikoensis]|uniref:LuxR C-terminal-related transcriptional regulator n=1 Tax=Streptomyces abikoensis TaxID=97398 RepID=UPI0035717A02